MKLKNLKTQEEFENAYFDAMNDNLRTGRAFAVIRNMISKKIRSDKIYNHLQALGLFK